MAYVFRRPAKDGKVRFTAVYKAENGQYRSAGTYDDEDRAQHVADESERHAHLRLAETSPAEKATITVEEFMPKFLREHAIEPNSRQRGTQKCCGYTPSPTSGTAGSRRSPARRSTAS